MKYFKFRAWDKTKKKMVKVLAVSSSIHGDCEEAYITVCELNEDASNKEVVVRYLFQGEYILLQCTEVVSVDPTIELFVGDIVKCFKDALSVVVHKQHAFGLETIGIGFTPFYEIYGQCEKVGDIYNNENLLINEPLTKE